MSHPEISVEYLSAGANRHTAVADWNADGVLAFGADCNVALWRPTARTPKGVFALLSGHDAVVKAVKFLPKAAGDETNLLITGADDHSLKIWSIDSSYSKFECIQTIKEHNAPVNCISALYSLSNSTPRIFVSGAADASIKIWRFVEGQALLMQTIKTTPKFFPLSLALSVLDDRNDVYILAAAGTRDTIQVFAADATQSSPQFSLQATLAGHEGWIRSLDFAFERDDDHSDLILASASQDKYVRLWRVHQGSELPAAAASDPSSGAHLPGRGPANKAHKLKAADRDFSITFEALLLGHEDWVCSARWHRPAGGLLRLLSTSADNSLAIWEADPSSGIWVSVARLGELSREKGATTATGSTGGFWTGVWNAEGSTVACLGRTGSWRVWSYNSSREQWVPHIAVSGHTKSVTGISWSRDSAYLLSTSSDQTTRLHAEWRKTGSDQPSTWHEMSRPQIHGYDLNCIDSLGDSQFVSGADEKLMRVFSEPRAVAKLLNTLNGIRKSDALVESMPDAANIPVLGLSNKAVDQSEPSADPNDPSAPPQTSYLPAPSDIPTHPPLEESLSRHTLWPETEKLYGHGYEISCLAVSHDATLIASACRATSTNHAVIRIFETSRWTECRPPLAAHTLTATRLRFSADDALLLSVGRDRQWAVFARDSSGDATKYVPLTSDPRGHARMILDAAWAPSKSASGSRVFATAGRDKVVKIWASDAEEKTFKLAATIKADHPVTAIDFLPQDSAHFVLAIGTEAGALSVCALNKTDLSVTDTIVFPTDLCVPKAVLQLSWRPKVENQLDSRATLAIAGADSSLRIVSLSLPSVQA